MDRMAVFGLRSHKSVGRCPLLELLWQRYHVKNHLAFFKISYELNLTLWSFFLDVRFLNQEAIEIICADAQCQNYLSDKGITLKTT